MVYRYNPLARHKTIYRYGWEFHTPPPMTLFLSIQRHKVICKNRWFTRTLWLTLYSCAWTHIPTVLKLFEHESVLFNLKLSLSFSFFLFCGYLYTCGPQEVGELNFLDKKGISGVPVVAQWDLQHIWSEGMRDQSLAWHSGLRIQCCYTIGRHCGSGSMGCQKRQKGGVFLNTWKELLWGQSKCWTSYFFPDQFLITLYFVLLIFCVCLQGCTVIMTQQVFKL